MNLQSFSHKNKAKQKVTKQKEQFNLKTKIGKFKKIVIDNDDYITSCHNKGKRKKKIKENNYFKRLNYIKLHF